MRGIKSLNVILLAVIASALMLLAGCSSTGQTQDPGIEDGTYVATFKSDSTMFHICDAYEDRGILTVEDGKMTIHVSLQSKKIVNLYPGTAEDAQKDGAELLEPTTDTVTYSDGYVDEVYGFDIPVPALDEEFDVALIGRHDNWYTHKVVVSDPVPGDDIQAVLAGETDGSEESDAAENAGTGDPDVAGNAEGTPVSSLDIADGEHSIDVTLEGGSGKASIASPAVIIVSGDSCTAVVEWSSPNYDYMIVDDDKYLPVNDGGNSVFEIPVLQLDTPMTVIADTTAMSEPHEIEYTLTFISSSVK